MGAVTVGVDIGQRRDPTAIAVAELEWRGRDGNDAEDDHYVVRYLSRLPLGTSYPAVADRVRDVVAGIARRTGDRPTVYADATGVGLPVVELLRERGLRVTSVLFTYGNRRTEEHDQVVLGKAYLVSRLQALLQSSRLHLPQTSESAALADELLDYEIRVDEDGDDKFGAFKVGTHDDMVTALGLAVHVVPVRFSFAMTDTMPPPIEHPAASALRELNGLWGAMAAAREQLRREQASRGH